MLGVWSGETKGGDRSKWGPSLEMVAATVKFALETKGLAEEQNSTEDVEKSGEEGESSDSKEDNITE